MRKSLIIITNFAVLLFATTVFAQTTPSNIIVFGDSLSDIGNFPQSQFVRVYNPLKIKQGHAVDKSDLFTMQNLYVPISNPITMTDGNYDLYAPSLINNKFSVITLPYPKLSNTHQYILPKQANIDGTVSLTDNTLPRYPRQAHSSGWVEYLFAKLYQNSQNQHQLIASSQLYRLKNTGNHFTTSVDYGWASALSDDACQDASWLNPDPNCTRQTVLTTAKAYAAKQSPETKINNPLNVKVPGMLKQVGFFLADNAKYHLLSPNSKIFIFTGGNDISRGLLYLLAGDKTNALRYISGQVTLEHINPAIQQLEKAGVKANQIYLINLFNIKYTPYAYSNSTLYYLAQAAVISFNLKMQTIVNQQKIHLVDFYNLFHSLVNQAGFKANIGKACDTDDLYDTLKLGKTPGKFAAFAPGQSRIECGDYLFWNSEHPAAIVEQELAYRIMQILNNPNTKQSTMLSLTQPQQANQNVKQLVNQLAGKKIINTNTVMKF